MVKKMKDTKTKIKNKNTEYSLEMTGNISTCIVKPSAYFKIDLFEREKIVIRLSLQMLRRYMHLWCTFYAWPRHSSEQKIGTLIWLNN